jgi:hypothetical protein
MKTRTPSLAFLLVLLLFIALGQLTISAAAQVCEPDIGERYRLGMKAKEELLSNLEQDPCSFLALVPESAANAPSRLSSAVDSAVWALGLEAIPCLISFGETEESNSDILRVINNHFGSLTQSRLIKITDKENLKYSSLLAETAIAGNPRFIRYLDWTPETEFDGVQEWWAQRRRLLVESENCDFIKYCRLQVDLSAEIYDASVQRAFICSSSYGILLIPGAIRSLRPGKQSIVLPMLGMLSGESVLAKGGVKENYLDLARRYATAYPSIEDFMTQLECWWKITRTRYESFPEFTLEVDMAFESWKQLVLKEQIK